MSVGSSGRLGRFVALCEAGEGGVAGVAVERVGTMCDRRYRTRILHNSPFRAALSSGILDTIRPTRTPVRAARMCARRVTFSWTCAGNLCASLPASRQRAAREPAGRVLGMFPRPGISCQSQRFGPPVRFARGAVGTRGALHPSPSPDDRRRPKKPVIWVAASHQTPVFPQRPRSAPGPAPPPLLSTRHVPTAGGSLSQPARIFCASQWAVESGQWVEKTEDQEPKGNNSCLPVPSHCPLSTAHRLLPLTTGPLATAATSDATVRPRAVIRLCQARPRHSFCRFCPRNEPNMSSRMCQRNHWRRDDRSSETIRS